MLSWEQGLLVIHCDGKRCAEVFETDEDNFNDGWEVFKDSDWTTRKVKNEWKHICPSCLEAEHGLVV